MEYDSTKYLEYKGYFKVKPAATATATTTTATNSTEWNIVSMFLSV